MGIFGDIVEGVESFFGSEFGQAVAGFGAAALQQRFLPPPQQRGPVFQAPPAPRPVSAGPFVAAGGGPAIIGDPATLQRRISQAFESLGGGPPMPGVFQTAALGSVTMAPQPVPFGIDPACPSFFRTGGMRATPTRFITATNPATGSLTFWEHAGQPILFARDMRVCKRVQKIARRAGTVSRRRTRKR